MRPSVPLPHNEGFEREIGGLVISGFEGRKVSRQLKSVLREGLGGVVLFPRNLGSPRSILKLVESIRQEAGQEGFIVAIDHEGGRVMRLGEPFTHFPPAAALGNSGDTHLAWEVGHAIARELRAVGINLNFSPVVDLDEPDDKSYLGDRSFGTDPAIATDMARAYIEGLESGGVAACAKHFPGHGMVKEDSHAVLPQTPVSRDEIEPHIEPFRAVAKIGVASIMTAHIRVHSLDPYYPATISPRCLDGLLRSSIGYGGVIITDDLQMAAIAGTFGPLDASFMALRAGADAVLFAHDLDLAVAARRHVDKAVRYMALSPDDIMEKAQRLRALKGRYSAEPKDLPPLDVIGCDEHRRLAKQVAEFYPP